MLGRGRREFWHEMLGDHIDVTEGIYPLHYACTLCNSLHPETATIRLCEGDQLPIQLNLLMRSTLQRMMTLSPIKLLI